MQSRPWGRLSGWEEAERTWGRVLISSSLSCQSLLKAAPAGHLLGPDSWPLGPGEGSLAGSTSLVPRTEPLLCRPFRSHAAGLHRRAVEKGTLVKACLGCGP